MKHRAGSSAAKILEKKKDISKGNKLQPKSEINATQQEKKTKEREGSGSSSKGVSEPQH